MKSRVWSIGRRFGHVVQAGREPLRGRDDTILQEEIRGMIRMATVGEKADQRGVLIEIQRLLIGDPGMRVGAEILTRWAREL